MTHDKSINIFLTNHIPFLVSTMVIVLILHQMTSLAYSYLKIEKMDRVIEQHQNNSEENTKHLVKISTADSNQHLPVQPSPASSKNIFFDEKIRYEVSAIFMDKAIINNHSVRVGDSIEKAVVEEIKIFSVVLNEQGIRKTIPMFGEKESSSGGNNIKSATTNMFAGIQEKQNVKSEINLTGMPSQSMRTMNSFQSANTISNPANNGPNNISAKVYKETKTGKIKEIKPNKSNTANQSKPKKNKKNQ